MGSMGKKITPASGSPEGSGRDDGRRPERRRSLSFFSKHPISSCVEPQSPPSPPSPPRSRRTHSQTAIPSAELENRQQPISRNLTSEDLGGLSSKAHRRVQAGVAPSSSRPPTVGRTKSINMSNGPASAAASPLLGPVTAPGIGGGGRLPQRASSMNTAMDNAESVRRRLEAAWIESDRLSHIVSAAIASADSQPGISSPLKKERGILSEMESHLPGIRVFGSPAAGNPRKAPHFGIGSNSIGEHPVEAPPARMADAYGSQNRAHVLNHHSSMHLDQTPAIPSLNLSHNPMPAVRQHSMTALNSAQGRSWNYSESSSPSVNQRPFLNQSAKSPSPTSSTNHSQATSAAAGSLSEQQGSHGRPAPKSSAGAAVVRRLSYEKIEMKDWMSLLPDVVDRNCHEIGRRYSPVGQELGRGNFGVVTVWMSKETLGLVACKSIAKSKLRHRKDVDDIRRETQVMHRLQGHPHVCQLHEVYEDAKEIHLVMELCPGRALSYQILQRKRLTEPEAVHVFGQVVEGVKWMHSCGVMHRDLKPENILLSTATDPINPTGVHVKLADFGLAVFLGDGELTTGIAGSPYYFAPEVVSGSRYGREADIWSLGVVLYVLLSGMLPFYGETEKDIFARIRSGKIVFNSKHWKGVSPQARKLVIQLLTMDPKQRPNAKQVLDNEWFAMFSK